MRILIVTPAYGGRGRGAAARRLARALAEARHDVRVLAAETDERDDLLMPVPEYPPMVPREDALAWTLSRNAALLQAASQAIRARNTDIVHAFGWETAWVAGAVRDAHDIAVVASPGRARRTTDGAHVEEARAWLKRTASGLISEPSAETARNRSERRSLAQRTAAAYERAIARHARHVRTAPSESEQLA